METVMTATGLNGTGGIVTKNSQRSFVKDAPNIARYSLADSGVGTGTGMDYHIQTITRDDKLRVLKFLRRFFFRDEPLNQSIGLIPEGEDSTCLELEEYCSVSSIENNLSLMAVSSSGAIIGVLLNGKMEPPCEDEPPYIEACANPKFKKILRLLHYVDKRVNQDGRFRGLNILEIRIISVDTNWRGKGVAKALIERATELGREKGFHVVRADCSSLFSGKVCQRTGFEPIYKLNYADYVDDDGNPVFSPAFPHTAIVTYVKKLQG